MTALSGLTECGLWIEWSLRAVLGDNHESPGYIGLAETETIDLFVSITENPPVLLALHQQSKQPPGKRPLLPGCIGTKGGDTEIHS